MLCIPVNPVAQFRKLPEWEGGQTKPPLKQLEAFACKVHIPFDCLFFSHPSEQSLPNVLDRATRV